MNQSLNLTWHSKEQQRHMESGSGVIWNQQTMLQMTCMRNENYAMESTCIHSMEVLTGIDTTQGNCFLKSLFTCPNPEKWAYTNNAMGYGHITPLAEPTSIATTRGALIVYDAVATVFS